MPFDAWSLLFWVFAILDRIITQAGVVKFGVEKVEANPGPAWIQSRFGQKGMWVVKITVGILLTAFYVKIDSFAMIFKAITVILALVVIWNVWLYCFGFNDEELDIGL